MRLAIAFVLTALGVAIYLADAKPKPFNLQANIAITVKGQPKTRTNPWLTSREAAKVKPDTKASEGPSFSRAAAKVKPDTKASEAPCPGNEECETACSFTVPTNTSMLCCCCEGLPPPEAGWSGWESCTEKKLYNCYTKQGDQQCSPTGGWESP